MDQARAQKYRARLSESYFLTENKHYLLAKFELIEPNHLVFYPGQYVSLRIGDGPNRRSYSIANTSSNVHGFDLLIEIIKGGAGSDFLRSLNPGDEIEVMAPMGRFLPHEGTKKLFIATGSGIVPVWSMINDLLIEKHVQTPIRLHWGMRNEAELFWMDNLERLTESHPNFVYDVVLSKPSENWELCSGHVQDCLTRDFAGSTLAEWEGYVSGGTLAVTQIEELLTKLGMTKEKIYTEKFT